MAMATYELKTQARCIVPHADEAHHAFLVATASLKGPNELRLLRYSEEADEVHCAAVWNVPHEFLDLAASTSDPSIIATVTDALDGVGPCAKLWKLTNLPEGGDDDDDTDTKNNGNEPIPHELTLLADVPRPTATSTNGSGGSSGSTADAPVRVTWAPLANGHSPGTFLTASARAVQSWTMREGGGDVSEAGIARYDSDSSFIGALAWDPHHASEVAVASGGSVLGWDLRSGERTRAIEHAVAQGAGVVRSLSYNPNRPWYMASGGDDFRVKIWDLRRAAAPLKVLDGHSHWVTSVAFNPFHDQVLLSGSTDCRTVLWRISSVSSAPLLELGEDDEVVAESGSGVTSSTTTPAAIIPLRQPEPRLATDQAIRIHADHEDSVTGTAWSVCGAWVYASVSFTGRVAIAQVPSAEKYRILL